MKPLKLTSTICTFLMMAGCHQVSASSQQIEAPVANIQPESLSDIDLLVEYLELNARAENVSYEILRANYLSCPQTAPQIGISVHTIRDYPEDMQAMVSEFLGVGDLPQIRHVVPASAADKAGLRSGDVVKSIGQYKLVGGASARQFYDGVSQLEFGLGQVSMEIMRGEETLAIDVRPDTLCGYAVEILVADFVNAYTDGEGIWLTTELLNATKDDLSLALIIAHELAHATQGHMFKQPTKALEVEADFIGMQYLLAAGYDGETALSNWIANPFNHEERAELTHPAPDDRIAAMQRALNISED